MRLLTVDMHCCRGVDGRLIQLLSGVFLLCLWASTLAGGSVQSVQKGFGNSYEVVIKPNVTQANIYVNLSAFATSAF